MVGPRILKQDFLNIKTWEKIDSDALLWSGSFVKEQYKNNNRKKKKKSNKD